MRLTSANNYFGERVTLARANRSERSRLTDNTVAHAQWFRLSQTLRAPQANLFVGCEDQSEGTAQSRKVKAFDGCQRSSNKTLCVASAAPVQFSFAFNESGSLRPARIIAHGISRTHESQLDAR